MQALSLYLRLYKNGRSRTSASDFVTTAIGKVPYFSRALRTWARAFLQDHKLPMSRQGKHANSCSFMWGEDIVGQLQTNLRKNKFAVDTTNLTIHINDVIIHSLGYAPPPTISSRTAMRWVKEMNLGFRVSAKVSTLMHMSVLMLWHTEK